MPSFGKLNSQERTTLEKNISSGEISHEKNRLPFNQPKLLLFFPHFVPALHFPRASRCLRFVPFIFATAIFFVPVQKSYRPFGAKTRLEVRGFPRLHKSRVRSSKCDSSLLGCPSGIEAAAAFSSSCARSVGLWKAA